MCFSEIYLFMLVLSGSSFIHGLDAEHIIVSSRFGLSVLAAHLIFSRYIYFVLFCYSYVIAR